MNSNKKMSFKTKNPRLLNSWLFFITILVIVLAILFYSLVYVKNNEKEQIAKRFRVLAQIGDNIVKRESGFRDIAGSASKRVTENERIKKKIKEISQREKDKKKCGEFYKDLLALIKDEIINANKLLMVAKNEPGRGNNYLELRTFEVKKVKGKIVKENKENENCKSAKYVIYIKANDFFDPLKRPDVFDELFVLKDEQNGSGNSRSSDIVLYHTSPGGLDITKLNKLKTCEQGIESGCLKEIKISNEKYKLFLQPIKLEPGDVESKDKRKWYVGGLVHDNKFKKETRELKSGVIIPFLIIFFIFILGIPLLKLFFMSTFEQLDIKDAILTSMSITFGVILLILLYLFIFQVNDDANNIRKNLGSLADEIKTKFTKELENAYDQLDKYELDLKKSELKSGDNIKDILTNPMDEGKNFTKINKSLRTKLRPSDYNLFKVVFWMDSKGQQILQFFTRNYFPGFNKLDHRKYFQDAGNWKLRGKSDSKFMLESITSITSGEKLAAISKRSNLKLKAGKEEKNDGPVKAEVAAMTSELTSLIDTIMPVGYGFCIIDETGDVWFHSTTERNLQENFIHEVENNKELRSAIYGKQERHIDLDYQSKSHKCFVMPVPDIPLYIITFHNMAYTNSVQMYTFFYTLFFIIILSLINGLLFVIAACGNYKESLLKRKFVPFDWLRPLKKNKDVYQYLTLSHLIIIFILIVFNAFTEGDGTFFLCISASLVSFAYNYYTITRQGDKEPLLVMNRLLNRLKENKLLSRISSVQSYLCFLLSWLVLVCIIPVIMFYIDAYNHENEVALKYLQVKFAENIEDRNFRIEKFYKEKMVKKENQGKESDTPSNPKDKRKEPNFISDTKKYRKESGIYLNVIGSKHAESIDGCLTTFMRLFVDNIIGSTHPEASDGYLTMFMRLFADNIIGRSHAEASDGRFNPGTTINNSYFSKIAYLLKPSLDQIAVEKRNLVFSEASDKSRIWWKNNDKLHLYYKTKDSLYNGETNGNGDKENIYIKTDMKYCELFAGFSLLLSVIAISLVLVLAYFLVRFTVRMIFGLKLLDFLEPLGEFDRKIRKHIKTGSDLIIYCQTKKEMDYCHDLFYEETASRRDTTGSAENEEKNDKQCIKVDKIIDLNSENSELAGLSKSNSSQIVFIKNFELYFNDIEKNLKKMNQVKELLRTLNIQVIIPTFIPLKKMMEYYHEKLVEISSEEKELQLKEKVTDSCIEEIRLQSKKFKKMITLLSEADDCWVALYVPLQTFDRASDEIKTSDIAVSPLINKIKARHIRRLILKEFKVIENFKEFEQSVYQYYRELKNNNDPKIEEKIILEIQELAKPYYNRLLKSCTNKEKYLLYDIAQNMLVNSNNLETQKILLKKGLIVCNGTCRLMNESFRNFILSSVDPGEAAHFMRELNAQSKWKSYKAPLILIVLGLVVFLALQDNLMSNVNAILTTVIGGLAILTKLSGVLTNFSPGKSK